MIISDNPDDDLEIYNYMIITYDFGVIELPPDQALRYCKPLNSAGI